MHNPHDYTLEQWLELWQEAQSSTTITAEKHTHVWILPYQPYPPYPRWQDSQPYTINNNGTGQWPRIQQNRG